MLPVEVSMAEITSEGLRFDRQYVLIKAPPGLEEDAVAEHLTIKTTFRMCLFQPSISDDWSRLTITHTLAQPQTSITIPLTPSPLSCVQSRTYQVSIFGTRAPGVDMGDGPAAFFSKHLDMPVKLLYIAGDGSRDIPGASGLKQPHISFKAKQAGENGKSTIQRIRFADASPLLVTSTASAADALSRLPADVRNQDVIIRLRPNIHIDVGPGVQAWDEDDWGKLFISSPGSDLHKATIRCIFRTPRCLSLNVDLKTGKAAPRDQQLYGLLAKDRRVNSAIPRMSDPACSVWCVELTVWTRQAGVRAVRHRRPNRRDPPRRRRSSSCPESSPTGV